MDNNLQYYIEVLNEITENRIVDEAEFFERYGNFSLLLCNPVYIKEPLKIYRSRLVSSIGKNEDITSPQTFSYIPEEITTSSWPKRGRLNKTGQSLFYGSFIPKTNYNEIKHDVKVGDEVYLSQWETKDNSNLRLYNMFTSDNVSCGVDLSTRIGIKNPVIVNSEVGDYVRRLANIFYSDQDYLKSSLIANSIMNVENSFLRNSKRCELVFDAITYSSVQISPHAIPNLNIAIKPEAVESKMTLQYVIKGKLLEDLQSISFENIGLPQDRKIIWYDFIFEPIIESIRFLKISDGNKSYDVNKCHIYDADNHIVVRNFFESIFAKKEKQEAFCNTISSNDIFNKLYSYDSNLHSIINEKIITMCANWPVYNWHFSYENEIYQARHLYLEENFLTRGRES